ncbi:alpha/beta fold hydrolase [Roseateles sp. DC23W]|uniref:Proline iminopeptidase n=1 Tax=Pelomonas dachongensis TaxID=3299029 RepID=A0ABW7EIY6_9BURK
MRTLLAALLLLSPLLGFAAEPLAPACAPGAGERAVREQGFVEINGIPQWLTITGQDCRHPVLLFVHGGPGNPNTPFADALFGAWAKDFTLVQWDQRGAGRTYGKNLPVRELEPDEFARTPLTLALLAADGIQVAEYLQRRLGQRQVILTGSSWGSALAVEMVHLRPELFHAYVGVAQLVGPADLAASHALALQRARELGDPQALATLQALGAPPWTEPRSFGKLRRILRGYEASRTDPGPAWKPAADYAGPQDAAALEAGEEFSFLKFVGFKGDGMLWRLNLLDERTRLKLPVFLVQGAEDLLTPPTVTRAWFDRLDAPRKQLVTVPRAGHDPNGPLLDAQLRVLKDGVLPLVR